MLSIRTTPLFINWVKNVYSLCVEGVVKGVKSSTYTHLNLLPAYTGGVKPQVFANNLDSFTPNLYTANFTHLPDTNNQVSTLSTVATIKKNKKK